MFHIKKRIILGSVAAVFVITAIALVIIAFSDNSPDIVYATDFHTLSPESPMNESPDTAYASDNNNPENVKSDSPSETSAKGAISSPSKSSLATTAKGSSSVPNPSKSGGTTAQADKSEDTTKYKKTGEMYFSDSPDNSFIKAVVKKYGSDSALLAAIYTVPQADGNTVLEFDGTKDSNGKLIRNGDTLKYIYTLDASYKVKKAGKKSSENDGYSKLDSSMMFYSVKKYLIPEYENEL